MSHPRKQFGQHWLQSEKALHRIEAAAELSSQDSILEIGPGTGVLTRKLLDKARSLVAVEIDRDLCQQLRQRFRDRRNFLLVEGDCLTIDLSELSAIDGSALNAPNKVVANIPYYITGPILEKLLGTIARPNPAPFESIVLLIQKEVADRVCANPGSRTFGALSVRVQYLATCELICTVPARAFYPPPKVDSAVVRLKPRSFVPSATQPNALETLIKLGFATKRKMLRNNLKGLVERDRLSDLLEKLHLNPQARAEDLGVADWVALSNTLSEGEPDLTPSLML